MDDKRRQLICSNSKIFNKKKKNGNFQKVTITLWFMTLWQVCHLYDGLFWNERVHLRYTITVFSGHSQEICEYLLKCQKLGHGLIPGLVLDTHVRQTQLICLLMWHTFYWYFMLHESCKMLWIDWTWFKRESTWIKSTHLVYPSISIELKYNLWK